MEDIHSWVECSLIYRKKLMLFRRLLEEHRTPAYVLQNTNCSPFYTFNAAVTAESIISVCENHGITIVTPESPLYPKCFTAQRRRLFSISRVTAVCFAPKKP